ncbi:MAG: hypothetical protein AABX53_01755 [Nanoarchaeota archaeon]
MKCYGLGYNQFSGEYLLSPHQDPRDERGRVAFLSVESLLRELPVHVKKGKSIEMRVAVDVPLDVLDKVKGVFSKGHHVHYVHLDEWGNPRPSIDLIPDSE